MTFNFNIFQCFSNIRNHLSNFSYLVGISCKIFIRWRFYLFLITENSRRVASSFPGLLVCLRLRQRRQLRSPGNEDGRVAESRPVCVGLNSLTFLCIFSNFFIFGKCELPQSDLMFTDADRYIVASTGDLTFVVIKYAHPRGGVVTSNPRNAKK
jgi:hypothetical protein